MKKAWWERDGLTREQIEGLRAAESSFSIFCKYFLQSYSTEQQKQFDRIINEHLSYEKPHFRIAIRSGHGTGKTAKAAQLILYLGIFKRDCKIIATAPGKPQLNRFLWPEIRKWHANLPIELQQCIDVHAEVVRFGNGNEAFGRTAPKGKPESIAGGHAKHMYWICDEASGIDPEVFQTIDGSLTGEYTGVVMLSQPTRTDGFFYEAFHKNKDQWDALHWPATESSLVTKQWLDTMKRRYSEKDPIYQIRVLGNFVELHRCSLITLDMIERAVEASPEPASYPAVWGIDIGLRGDRSALAKRRFLEVFEIKTWFDVEDPMKLASEIFYDYQTTPAEIKPARINVEWNGIGVSVYSRLKQLGAPVYPCDVCWTANREKCANKRTEMYLNFKDALLLGLKLPDDEELHADIIHGSQYTFDQKGNIALLPKKDIKHEYGKSPDLSDAVALTFFDEMLVPEQKDEYLPPVELPSVGLY